VKFCIHCSRPCDTYDAGHATIDEFPVCRPNAPGRPDCYHMITVYHHRVVGCGRCEQEPYQPPTKTEIHDAFVEALANLERLVRDALP
jgi:hypothetical protein